MNSEVTLEQLRERMRAADSAVEVSNKTGDEFVAVYELRQFDRFSGKYVRQLLTTPPAPAREARSDDAEWMRTMAGPCPNGFVRLVDFTVARNLADDAFGEYGSDWVYHDDDRGVLSERDLAPAAGAVVVDEAAFTAYFLANYPAGTIISNPGWHAPRIFRAALTAAIGGAG